MGNGGLIAAIGLGGVAAWFILRRQDQSTGPVAPPSSSSSSFCDALPAGQARELCKGALGVGKVVQGLAGLLGGGPSGPTLAEKDAQNRALNGQPEEENQLMNTGVNGQRFTARSSTCVTYQHPIAWGPNGPKGVMMGGLNGTVAKFRNGCVPAKGAAGWEKCAPGTNDMFSKGPGYGGHRGAKPEQLFTGRVGEYGDTSSGYHRSGAKACDTPPFPIQVPSGHFGLWSKGKPYTCPNGTVPDFAGAGDGAPACKPNAGYVPKSSQQVAAGASALGGFGAVLQAVGLGVPGEDDD